jgi:predicted 3-demethylubiquinone-9 3-methyltransferase (glyoxalase superfamily)
MLSQPIYPCIWFNNQAQEAATFYCTLFSDAKIISGNPIVTQLSIGGIKLMLLNGGNKYQPTAAISYYVYCSSKAEQKKIYDAFTEKGKILMPLDKYVWSEQYAWVADEYGVNWQLDISPINSTQTIVPSLLFANEKFTLVKEAASMYTSIFQNSTILLESPHDANPTIPDGALLFTQFKLSGFIFNAMSSNYAHDFDFSPGNSFVIECENQQEIDFYWEKLGDNGRYDMCGWLADKYGISWQIVPAILGTLMGDAEKAPRVIQAFLQMQKFDIETLLNA